jgi:AcrR family transcriptional regulator
MALPHAISDDPTPAADPAAEPSLQAASSAHAADTPSPLESSPLPLESAPLPSESQDPRVRRTRQLLQQALADLLHTRDFDKLSVHEITTAAGLNRATFYAHYPDKFALLECMVAGRFHTLLDERGIAFNGACTGAIQGIVLGVCDFLAQTLSQLAGTPCAAAANQMPPHMESAIIAVVRGMLLDGIRNHPPAGPIPPAATPELLASTASWAIYGAAREWVRTPDRGPSEEVAATIQRLVIPILHPQSA